MPVGDLAASSTNETAGRAPSLRHSLLDLAPLELDCMNTLWPVGEATVREIRDGLAPRRARAYTTIMTIMDRLARKGIVERRKSGRAYVYRPKLTAEEARGQALGQVLEKFFGGSKQALLEQLGNDDGIHREQGVISAGSSHVSHEPSVDGVLPARGLD
jgi:predicted transcriptional regulator